MQDVTKMLTMDFIQVAIANPRQDEQCVDMHACSCNYKAFSQFVMGCRSVYKMYIIVHLLPFLIFKRKKFFANPRQELKKLVVNFIKSLLFAGGYSFLIRRIVCWVTQYYKFTEHCSTLSAIFGSPTLCFEPISRQSQIALFCLNKSMEVSYNMLLRRSYPVRVPMGQCVLMGVALALITFIFLEDSLTVRQNYRKAVETILKNI